jgi:hypothetical protein
LILSNTHANPTAGASLLNLDYTANGDANGIFIDCTDNAGADSKFTVGLDGLTTIAGNATGTDALVVAAGDINVTAGDIDIGADNRRISFGASGDTDSYIFFDGAGNLTFFDSTVASETTLNQLLNSLGTDPTITGNLTISDGQFDWTDSTDEVAGTWAFTGAANNDITWTSSCTTANCLDITADAMTSGSMIHLDNTADGFTGEYIRCFDGTAEDFSVRSDGSVFIAGNAAGTDALTITLGDLFVSDTDGSIIESENGTATMLTLDNKAGVIADNNAVCLIDAGGAVASGGNLLRVAPTGTPNAGAIGIEFVGAGKALTAMTIDADPTASDVVEINGGGALTNGLAVLAVTNDGNLAAGGCNTLLTLGGTPDADARCLELDSQKDAIAIFADSDAVTDHAYQFTHPSAALAATKAVMLVSDAGDPAAITSSVLEAAYSGTGTNKAPIIRANGTGVDVPGLWIDTDNTVTQTSASVVLYTNADAAAGPSIVGDLDRATPAADDKCLEILSYGEDSGGGETLYAGISFESLVVTAGSEEGQIKMQVNDGAAQRESFWLTDDTLALGDSAAFVLGSNGAQDLTISTAIDTAGVNANEPKIVMTDGAAGDITITAGGTSGEIVAASPVAHSSTETIAAGAGGALALTTSVSLLETDGGGDAYTLAAGVAGQIKFVTLITFGGGNGVLTLTGNPAAYDVITFTAVGQSALLVYTASGWMPISLQGATIA